MKSKLLLTSLILCLIFSFTALCGCTPPITYTQLGIPTQTQHFDNAYARCVWDVKVYDGKVYIGCGDYDKNSGPTTLWAYDLKTNSWEQQVTVDEEAIARFITIDGTLYITGIDTHPTPDEDHEHELGNFYRLENGVWKKYRNLPHSIHNFDMTLFNGKLFSSLGAENGFSPIVYSVDNGNTFSQVQLVKDGNEFITEHMNNVRAYEFITLNDRLYSIVKCYIDDKASYNLFEYNGECFEFVLDITNSLLFNSLTENLINNKVIFKDKLYFCTGALYCTTDARTFDWINIDNCHVQDIACKDGYMYVLCAKKISNMQYTTLIYKTADGEQFSQVYSLSYFVSPTCFDFDSNDWYVGYGDKTVNNVFNGMVLKINLDD